MAFILLIDAFFSIFKIFLLLNSEIRRLNPFLLILMEFQILDAATLQQATEFREEASQAQVGKENPHS
jgi:hypothetical protein